MKSRGPPTAVADRIDDVLRAAEHTIRQAAPAAHTEVKWGHPWFVGIDPICVVGAFTRHVGVEFWRGTTIPDPRGLLEGTGKNLRHVKLRTVLEATSPQFAALVRSAVRLDRRAE